MSDLLGRLPAHFRAVPYNGSAVPDGDHDLGQGANCQRYAYAVLAHFGRTLPPFRSSELWTDCVHTELVTMLEPLDLLLFADAPEPYGAHIAVYAGDGAALHLCQSAGVPQVWPLERFLAQQRYACLLGAKRVCAKPAV